MIKLEQVGYVYMQGGPFEKTALNNVSLTINRGEFIGLIGHTGSGKSTLIQMLNGLLKPTSGKIFIDGKELNSKDTDMRQIRFDVGLVMQYPEYQLFEETVAKDIAFGPTNMGLSPEEIEERVKFAANMVGLKPALLDKSPFDLSGGQKRRVAIAGVLAMEPKVLILDEPTAGLDPAGRDEILFKIKDMHERMDMTVILVSHSMEDIAKLADRILVMNQGEVAMFDRTDAVFRRGEELTRMGLNVPQITRITDSLRKQGVPIREGIYTVEDALNELAPLLRQEGARLC
ncbi:MAG: energy-coupling factor transporter ATPase [Clostridia bacterium]|nr:energy-coupling factor transporter ATPase [Clostridia bacterium]MBQ2940979.1 energy-coupling factor transporter ATPase [Clostridia bacterium]